MPVLRFDLLLRLRTKLTPGSNGQRRNSSARGRPALARKRRESAEGGGMSLFELRDQPSRILSEQAALPLGQTAHKGRPMQRPSRAPRAEHLLIAACAQDQESPTVQDHMELSKYRATTAWSLTGEPSGVRNLHNCEQLCVFHVRAIRTWTAKYVSSDGACPLHFRPRPGRLRQPLAAQQPHVPQRALEFWMRSRRKRFSNSPMPQPEAPARASATAMIGFGPLRHLVESNVGDDVPLFQVSQQPGLLEGTESRGSKGD